MDQSIQYQFQRLPREAQQAVFQRLSLSGQSTEEIAERTGWSVEQVQDVMTQAPTLSRESGQGSVRRRWRRK
jgi:DNA-directed RNA polymerase specialized sigma24 family protein